MDLGKRGPAWRSNMSGVNARRPPPWLLIRADHAAIQSAEQEQRHRPNAFLKPRGGVENAGRELPPSDAA
jgi:hypothetical protein